jgi:hypothetical protein
MPALPEDLRERRDSAEDHEAIPVLYRRLLGDDFDLLPAAVRRVHGAATAQRFEGRASARCGRGLASRLGRRLLGMPASGRYPVEVWICPDASGETWTRRFGSASFTSRLVEAARAGHLEERLGPMRFRFALAVDPDGVTWRMAGWSLGGLAMPAFAGPRVRARADAAGALYRFNVVVAHPWFGPLFAYRGTLG